MPLQQGAAGCSRVQLGDHIYIYGRNHLDTLAPARPLPPCQSLYSGGCEVGGDQSQVILIFYSLQTRLRQDEAVVTSYDIYTRL